MTKPQDAETQKRVLVVEDDSEIRAGLVHLIKSCGFHVDQSSNGLEGIDCATRKRPDAIVADIRMPKLNGLEMLQRLRANLDTRSIPVLILSASPGDQDNAIDAGAAYFERKPFRSQHLIHLIQRMIHYSQRC